MLSLQLLQVAEKGQNCPFPQVLPELKSLRLEGKLLMCLQHATCTYAYDGSGQGTCAKGNCGAIVVAHQPTQCTYLLQQPGQFWQRHLQALGDEVLLVMPLHGGVGKDPLSWRPAWSVGHDQLQLSRKPALPPFS